MPASVCVVRCLEPAHSIFLCPHASESDKTKMGAVQMGRADVVLSCCFSRFLSISREKIFWNCACVAEPEVDRHARAQARRVPFRSTRAMTRGRQKALSRFTMTCRGSGHNSTSGFLAGS